MDQLDREVCVSARLNRAMAFFLYFTLGAIVTYAATDWILNHIEQTRGKRFAQRNVIFFIILFVLAMLLMHIINPVPKSLSKSLPAAHETGESVR